MEAQAGGTIHKFVLFSPTEHLKISLCQRCCVLGVTLYYLTTFVYTVLKPDGLTN